MKIKEPTLQSVPNAVTRPPNGAHCFVLILCLFLIINVSLHTPLTNQWNPCEAYQLTFIIKHKHLACQALFA